MNSKERCLAAIHGQPVDRVPAFPLLMFFAQQRQGITYREFATNGRVMAESQLRMRERFPIDAVTACTDAFRVVADLGAEMAFPEDRPPYAVRPVIAGEGDLKRLSRPDPGDSGTRMADRVLGCAELARSAGDDCLTLGWVDMPFAEACSVCGVSEFMLLLHDEPALAHGVLEFLTGIVVDFALAQLEAGVPMMGAGDAAASLVSPAQYREFALPYEQRVCAAVRAAGGLTKLHICGDTAHLMGDMKRSGADLFNVDHLVDFSSACRAYGEAGICFKGNLDPVADMLQATPEECAERAVQCLGGAEGLPFILSPGCEVPADTSDEVFQAFCEAPQRFSGRS